MDARTASRIVAVLAALFTSDSQLLAGRSDAHTTPAPSREITLALVRSAESSEPSPTTVEYGEHRYEIGESRRVRAICADIEPGRRGDGVRLTFEPHDAIELGTWIQSHRRSELAWCRGGEIVSTRWIDGPRTDFLAFGDIEPEKQDALVAEIGPSRDAVLAKAYGEPLDASSWIELERKSCAQRCAAYTLRVNGDGSIVYVGMSDVAQIGERREALSAVATRRLFLRMAAADWFATPAEGSVRFETTTVTLRVGAKTKRVGSRSPVPDDELVDVIAQALDHETRALRWTGRLDPAARKEIARVADYTPKTKDDFEIRLERTACYGWCPIYTVVVHGDGTVDYTGTKYVGLVGEAHTKVSRDIVEDLVDRLQDLEFWQMRDRYDDLASDIPSAVVSLRIGDRSKEVVNRWIRGDEDADDLEIHQELEELALAIDLAVDAQSWIETR